VDPLMVNVALQPSRSTAVSPLPDCVMSSVPPG